MRNARTVVLWLPTFSFLLLTTAPRTSAQATSTSGTSLLMTSVSIKNSPGVPDTGGHSIIIGLMRGSLTAVEPNLFLCVTPTGGRKSCTDVCPPGHDCTKRLGNGIRINGSKPSVHVEVMDNDKQGHVTSLGAADITDATICTQSQPCTNTFPDPTSPDPAHGTDSTFYFEFKPVGSPAPASTLTVAAQVAAPQGCHGPYDSVEDAMKKDPNGLDALNDTGDGDIEYGYIIERDSSYLSKKSGGYYTTPPVKGSASTMSVDDYSGSYLLCPQYQTFQAVATVHTHPIVYPLLKKYLNLNMNQNFTPSDFTQSVQAKISKQRTWWDKVTDLLGTECVPTQGFSGFEKVVMIYVGDRKVRTFEPGAGDCTFSTVGMLLQNKIPYSEQWKKYVDRTCIVPNVWSWKKKSCVP